MRVGINPFTQPGSYQSMQTVHLDGYNFKRYFEGRVHKGVIEIPS